MPDVRPFNADRPALAPSPNGGPSGILSQSASSSSLHSRDQWPMEEGASGTFEALSLMCAAVKGQAPPDFSGYQDPWNKAFALERLGKRATPGSIDAAYYIFYLIRDGIAYFEHPPDEQVVQDCRRTIELGHGDCVSQSVCLATLLAALGYTPQFVIQHPSLEDGYTHVYVELLFDGQRIALDPIADGKEGRQFGQAGWSQPMPDGGFETTIPIF